MTLSSQNSGIMKCDITTWYSESSLGYVGNNTELESLNRADSKTTLVIVLRLRDPYLIRAGLCEYTLIMITTQPIWAKCWRP